MKGHIVNCAQILDTCTHFSKVLEQKEKRMEDLKGFSKLS